MRIHLFALVAVAACGPDADTIVVDLSPSLVSSLDGTTRVTALVAGDQTPLVDQVVHATIAYTDRNGTPRDIAPLDGKTDDRGVFVGTIEGLVWEGTGTLTLESGAVTTDATFAVLDRTPPTIEILPPTTDMRVGQGLPLDVRVHVTDEIGISEVTLDARGDIDGGRSTLVASGALDTTLNFRLTVDANATAGPTITLHALARDLSGNLAAAAEITLTVDPSITIATPPGLAGTVVATGTQNQLADPRSIVHSSKDGKLYIADVAGGVCAGGCIWRVDPATGAIDATPVVVGQGEIEGVALDATGDNLYFTDRQDRTGRLTWNGTAYTNAVACSNAGAQHPQEPYHLVVDPTLGLLVADVDRREVTLIATCAPASVGTTFSMIDAFEEPRGLALGPAGEIYVADFNRDRIFTVDRTTGVVTTYASADQPYGIEWMLGTSPWGNKLMVASTGDRVVETVTGEPLAAAYLREPPVDLAITGGTMYVITEPTGNTRGRIYKIDGF